MNPENTPAPEQQPTPAPAVIPPAPQTPPAPLAGAAIGRPGGPSQSRPPQPGGPRPGGATRPFPQGNKPNRGDKPMNPGGKPEALDRRDFAALKPNSRLLDKEIEDELNQAMAGFDAKATIAPPVPPPGAARPLKGARKSGRVVGIHGKDVFIEVPGGRGQGVLPTQQFEGQIPQLGDVVEFDIDHYDAGDGLLILTRQGSVQAVSDWSGIAYGMIVEAKVTGTNKNKTGLTVEVNGIKGFLPASQLDLYRVENIDQFVNQRLKVMVAEVIPEERNLIVSRRAVLEREKQVKGEQFWATVAEGKVQKGIVRSVKPFGVFVDLGGADGLLPVSEISWQRVNDPNELFKVGDSVEVKINRIDFEARKISLSLRALTTSPWDEFAKEIMPGARVTGKVTRLADFGAPVNPNLRGGVGGG